MNHHTDTIPFDLAKKLKEKGMPIETEGENIWCPSYAEVFDWFASRNIHISIAHRMTSVGLSWWPIVNGKNPRAIDGREWHHSANVAIEEALVLTK